MKKFLGSIKAFVQRYEKKRGTEDIRRLFEDAGDQGFLVVIYDDEDDVLAIGVDLVFKDGRFHYHLGDWGNRLGRLENIVWARRCLLKKRF